MTLADVQATFERWLYLPDPMPLLAVLGAVAANRMSGDPVWLQIVGPPSSGKTELLEPLRGLTDVHAASTLTEAALLSGTPSKERAKGSKGGLLHVMGERGILICKDFGSVLSMQRDARAGVLAALREIYDGAWTRHVGTEGGRTLTWTGHVGLIVGCPPTLDRHHAVMASLGERFVLLRLEEISGADQAQKALAHAGHESAMRRELTAAVATFLAGVSLPQEPLNLAEEQRNDLVQVASLVSRCRSAVERDGYSREIELVPGAEVPTRLAVTLKRLHDGLAAIGVDEGMRWRIVRRVALDSMPAIRRNVLTAVVGLGETDTAAVATALGYPSGTTRRTLEDLAAYHVVERISGGKGKTDRWQVSESIRDFLRTIPEMSGGLRNEDDRAGASPLPVVDSTNDDISGKVPALGLGEIQLDAPIAPCPLCRGRRFWRPRIGGPVVCATCHPPACEDVEWLHVGHSPEPANRVEGGHV